MITLKLRLVGCLGDGELLRIDGGEGQHIRRRGEVFDGKEVEVFTELNGKLFFERLFRFQSEFHNTQCVDELSGVFFGDSLQEEVVGDGVDDVVGMVLFGVNPAAKS